MKKAHLVFIPSPGLGHIFSAVEFAKLLVNRDDRISITVFIMESPFHAKTPPFSPSERLEFVHLHLEPSKAEPLQSLAPGIMYSELVEINKPRVRDIISSESYHLSAFLVDMFCTPFIDVANEFSVPTYTYFTSSVGFLGLMFHLQVLEDHYDQDIYEFKNSDSMLSVPVFSNLVPTRHLPLVMIDKDVGFPNILDIPRRLREAKGILVNTFAELEHYAITSLSNDDSVPPIYTIGPLLTDVKQVDKSDKETEKNRRSDEIMSWLDNQPSSSVVLLCFGSMGSFEKEQIVEIANALERSGQRFLWALRCPPTSKRALPTKYNNLNDVLPEGFLDRTSTMGKITGWIPQVAVLSHPAVGGFVSHCGWNSTLESLCCGVPIATWPLYAEQKINAFELVKELGLSVEIKIDCDKDMVVKSDEIEAGIRQLMEKKSYSVIREKVKDISEKSKVAVESGGSSHNAVGRFIEDLIGNSS